MCAQPRCFTDIYSNRLPAAGVHKPEVKMVANHKNYLNHCDHAALCLMQKYSLKTQNCVKHIDSNNFFQTPKELLFANFDEFYCIT